MKGFGFTSGKLIKFRDKGIFVTLFMDEVKDKELFFPKNVKISFGNQIKSILLI